MPLLQVCTSIYFQNYHRSQQERYAISIESFVSATWRELESDNSCSGKSVRPSKQSTNALPEECIPSVSCSFKIGRRDSYRSGKRKKDERHTRVVYSDLGFSIISGYVDDDIRKHSFIPGLVAPSPREFRSWSNLNLGDE